MGWSELINWCVGNKAILLRTPAVLSGFVQRSLGWLLARPKNNPVHSLPLSVTHTAAARMYRVSYAPYTQHTKLSFAMSSPIEHGTNRKTAVIYVSKAVFTAVHSNNYQKSETQQHRNRHRQAVSQKLRTKPFRQHKLKNLENKTR